MRRRGATLTSAPTSPSSPPSSPPSSSIYQGTNEIRRPIRRTYSLGSRSIGIRNVILENLQHDFCDEPFLSPFVRHLRKIGNDKLDIYSEIIFELTEFNTILTFRATREEPNEMTYTIPDITLEPDERLVGERVPVTKTAWAGWRPW